MNKDELKSFLASVGECRLEARRLKKKLLLMCSSLSEVRGESVKKELEEIAELYEKKLLQAERRQLDAEMLTDSLPSPECRMIVRLRYCQRRTWPVVLRTLREAGYELSERTMYRLHAQALELLGNKGGTP